MKPVKFPEMQLELQAPNGQPDVEPLPVYTNGTVVTSCWQPNIRERFSILLFGRIWLMVRSGRTQPPVALWAGRENFLKAEECSD